MAKKKTKVTTAPVVVIVPTVTLDPDVPVTPEPTIKLDEAKLIQSEVIEVPFEDESIEL